MNWNTAWRATVAVVYALIGGLFGYVITLTLCLVAAQFVRSSESASTLLALAPIVAAVLAGIASALGYFASEPRPKQTAGDEQPQADERGPDERA